MITREEFEHKDRIVKGITADGHFKVSVVKTTEVIRTARERHNLSLLNTVLLGRALTGVMLLASELKGEERIQLRLEGNGPVGMLVAEANSIGEIRGYVSNPTAELDYSSDNAALEDGLGVGLLHVRKTLYNEAEPHTSTIQLMKSDVTTDLAHYLVQSQQVPSALKLDVGIGENGEVTEAGGLLVQKLPGAPDENIAHLQDQLTDFPELDTLLSDGHYIDDIMKQALKPNKVKELTRCPVHFFCRCSKERFKGALALISFDELREMKDEGQELVCHFCNERYNVSKEEVEKIVTRAQAKMN